MKKKVLMKRILTALAMAAMIPAGETWAAEFSGTEGQDDYTILIDGSFYDTYVWGETTGVLPNYTNVHTGELKKVSEFKNIIVNDALEVKSLKKGEGNISDTNLTITVPEGSGENSNALHVSGSNTDFSVKNFTAHVSAPNSGAITIDNTAANSTVTVNEKLEATVANGNGIRANASFTQGAENKIIVVGDTDITLAGGQVTYKETKKVQHSVWKDTYSVTSQYNPAAVYAGNDSIQATVTVPKKDIWGNPTNDTRELSLGNEAEAQGQGIIELGNTKIQIGSNNYGLYAGKNGQINVGGNLSLTANGDNAVGIAAENSTLIYKDKNKVKVDDKEVTPIVDTSENHFGSSVILNGDANVITVTGENSKAIYAEGVDANGNSNTVKSGDNGIGYFAITGNVVAENGGNITLDARNAESVNRLKGDLTADGVGSVYVAEDEVKKQSTIDLSTNNILFIEGNAAAVNGGNVTLKGDVYSGLTGDLTADKTGSSASLEGGIVAIRGDASATAGGTVELAAGSYGGLTGSLTADGAGSSASLSGYHVVMEGNASATAGGTVSLTAGHDVSLMGALTASGEKSEASGEKSEASMTSNGTNYISSKSVIAHAGDLDTSTDDQFKNKSVISALYAEDGADITISSAQSNTFLTAADPDDEMQLERVIWAYNGADINIDGTTLISTDRYEKSANSNDIAIAAGTAVGINENTNFDTPVDRAEVNLNYGAGSSVTGDIIAGYAGKVNIDQLETAGDAGINIRGNLLAGNNGILNVDLGNGGTLTGRADDYGDAGVVTTEGYTNSFRDPAFSSDIYKGGAVNLTMGAGSRWNVTGQSWITSIDTNAAGKTADVLAEENPSDAIKNMATIDLVSANTDYSQTAHALTIYKMDGDAVFNMSLDGNRSHSDMLYMKEANGEYIVNLKEAVGVDDMFASMGSDGKTFTGLRFATVGADSDVSFHVFAKDTGMQNIEYTVETDKYEENEENAAYDSTNGTGDANEQKPGSDMVKDFFGNEGKPPTDSENSGEESANGQIMLLAEGDEAAGTSTATTETTNFKLTGVKGTELSDAGKTVVNMSKVNYSNAVYMDRLNKRMGEARYLDGDDGLWVRLRHDRIGKDNAFRSLNTMMELGYEWKAKGRKDGEHRQGVAFDYMRGEADYTNVMGSGDVRRAGVWLYDTWLGDRGHYTDYVVKYGRLSNDFDIYARTSGNKISGDYDNDVWSASAEYGRKKDIGSDWYFEPQAQLQYAYVTSADYTTSQGTKVKLDGIDSLIGRAGFRLGRDINEGNTVYFKADVLHEFLGDQKVHASDITGALDTTYENEGTWYDVGFGFSHRMGKDSYMFLDLEHSFGNDNDETYQINIGLSKAF